MELMDESKIFTILCSTHTQRNEEKAHSRPRAHTNIILVINARKSYIWSKKKVKRFCFAKTLSKLMYTHDCYTFVKYEFRMLNFAIAQCEHSFHSKSTP